MGRCGSSGSGALHHDGARHHVIHSSVVLEEQQRDEGWEEEGDGEVLVQGSDGGSAGREAAASCPH